MARPVRKRSIRLVERPRKVARYWRRIVITDTERERIGSSAGWIYVGARSSGALTIEAGIFEIAPGEGKATVRLHSHGDEECGYILHGRGWVAIEDERHEFRAGDFVFIPAQARHAWRNDGRVVVRVLFFRRQKPLASGRPLDVREFDVQEVAD